MFSSHESCGKTEVCTFFFFFFHLSCVTKNGLVVERHQRFILYYITLTSLFCLCHANPWTREMHRVGVSHVVRLFQPLKTSKC